jgi:leucyl aminopeptidase
MLEFSQSSAAADAVDGACVVVGVFEDAKTPAAAAIDDAGGGVLARLKAAGDFTGKPGATLVLHGVSGVKAPRVVLVGLGRKSALDAHAFLRACNEAGNALKGLPVGDAAVYLPEVEVAGHDADWRVRTCALAIDHACFRYTATLKPAGADVPRLQKLALAAADVAKASRKRAPSRAASLSLANSAACRPTCAHPATSRCRRKPSPTKTRNR